MRRAAEASGVAWTDLSQWAEGIPTGTLQGRLDPSDPPLFTLGLTEYGTNDRNTASALVKTRMISHWTWLTSGPVPRLGQTTMPPYVDASSASFLTLDDQVGIDAAWRDDINGWLRDGAPIISGAAAPTGTTDSAAVRAGAPAHPLIGICDIASAVEAENSRGEKVWRVDHGRATADGVHPTRVGADLMEPAATAWITERL